MVFFPLIGILPLVLAFPMDESPSIYQRPHLSKLDNALIQSVKGHDFERIISLIGLGGNVNLNETGWNRLEVAINGHQPKNDILGFLVEAGGNVNAPDSRGWTPLMKWAIRNDSVVTKLLIDAGANVNYADPDGFTGLMVASFNHFLEVVELLIDAGADLNAIEYSDGDSALNLVVGNNCEASARLLIDRGADIHQRNNHGRTALMIAASKNIINLVKILLDSGADKSQIDNEGLTASQQKWVRQPTRDFINDYEPDFAVKRR